jgi:hypothetical protein
LPESQSFLLSQSQIPLKDAKSQSTVQVIMSFGCAGQCGTVQRQPRKIKLVGTAVAVEKTGKRQPTITVENPSRVARAAQRRDNTPVERKLVAKRCRRPTSARW